MIPKEKEVIRSGIGSINIFAYLEGRIEHLKGTKLLYPPESSKHQCAEARLFEVSELLSILKADKEATIRKEKK